MKTVWKWVLGIVIVLVVVGLVVGAVFMWQHRPAFGMRSAPFAYRQYQQNAPNNQGNSTPQNNQSQPASPNGTTPKRPMMGRGFGYGQPGFGYGPMMMNRRGFNQFGMMMPFGPFGMMGFMFFGLIRLIFPLGVLVLVAYVFYQLGKQKGMSKFTAPPTSPAPVSAPESNPQN
ncbi:MAG: hypothetical protein WBW94_09555 [Anaerolineales bacterium]